MKKLLFALSFATILVSCKKDKNTDFTATDVTGTSNVKGNVSKNVITPNGFGGFTNSSRVPAAGVNVTVKVNKNSLYPNSNAQGADIYTGTTDANGNYSIPVKTNASGVSAMITIDGFTATEDTLVNGTTKPGLLASYSGTSFNRTLYMGQNAQIDYSFTASNIISNPNNIVVGTAVITGSLSMSVIKEFTVTGFPSVINYTTADVKVPNHMVYMNFSNDPTTQSAKTYTATTDANGYYTFTVSTVANGTPGFSQNADIWAPDFATTRDTVKLSGATVTGPAGVFQMTSTNQNSIFNGTIRNAAHLNYFSFTAN